MAFLTTAERAGVTVLTVDRPPANALDLELLDELNATIAALAERPLRALVLAGRPGFFSAGLDLKAIPSYSPAQGRRLVDDVNRMVLSIYGLPFPVVCAITGHAIAGGLVLALCGDHRIVSSEGRYGFTEIKVGVPFPAAAIGVVEAELSPGTARALTLSGALVDSRECLRLGVFDEVVAPDEVSDRAVALAAELADVNPETYARTKAQLRGAALERMRNAAGSDPLSRPG
jgi:enoyl-CoA hydratase